MNIDIIILVVSGSSSIIIFFLKSMYEYIRSERNKIKQMRTELLKNKLSLFWLLFLHSLKHNHLSETYNLLCDGSPKSGDLSLSFNSDSDLQRIRKYVTIMISNDRSSWFIGTARNIKEGGGSIEEPSGFSGAKWSCWDTTYKVNGTPFVTNKQCYFRFSY